MTTAIIHRFIEQHAAVRGDVSAVCDGRRVLTYRELNYAANAMARRLLARGFRRGANATVIMPFGVDLAVVLLAILKSGGSYTWSVPAKDDAPQRAVCFQVASGDSEDRFMHLDISRAIGERVPCSPNLPIVARDGDVACILPGVDGRYRVLVPHATITALRRHDLAHGAASCAGHPGAFDLWVALTAGATAVVAAHATTAAAA